MGKLRKSVTVEFNDEKDALAFLEFIKNITPGKLKCEECGYVYPFHCENAECEDV